LFGTSLDGPLINYVEAIQAFRRSDASLYGKSATWYSYYMEEFVRLIERGEDPRERSNYPGISAVQDLQGQLALALEGVVDSVMPATWKAYKAAYLDLEKAVEATG
jgi:hypothetical protein